MKWRNELVAGITLLVLPTTTSTQAQVSRTLEVTDCGIEGLEDALSLELPEPRMSGSLTVLCDAQQARVVAFVPSPSVRIERSAALERVPVHLRARTVALFAVGVWSNLERLALADSVVSAPSDDPIDVLALIPETPRPARRPTEGAVGVADGDEGIAAADVDSNEAQRDIALSLEAGTRAYLLGVPLGLGALTFGLRAHWFVAGVELDWGRVSNPTGDRLDTYVVTGAAGLVPFAGRAAPLEGGMALIAEAGLAISDSTAGRLGSSSDNRALVGVRARVWGSVAIDDHTAARLSLDVGYDFGPQLRGMAGLWVDLSTLVILAQVGITLWP